MALSWDLFIILFFVILTVYGLLLGKGRIFNILISSYVGLVIATELGNFAFDYLSKAANIQHSFSLSLFGVQVFVFALVIFILVIKNELSGVKDDSSNSVYTGIYGFLTAGLILSTILSFMTASERVRMFSISHLASLVHYYWYFWLIAPIIFVLVVAILGRLVKK